MRFYAVGNQYLSSIQQGIQAFHVLGEMAIFYAPRKQLLGASNAEMMYHDWLNNHKTVICLNGGNNAALTDFWYFIHKPDHNTLPYSKFNEDDASMGGMLTSIGIVVPEKIYGIRADDASTWLGLSAWEVELGLRLKKMPTAR